MLNKLSESKKIQKELTKFNFYIKQINEKNKRTKLLEELNLCKQMIKEIDDVHSGFENGELKPTLTIETRNKLFKKRKSIQDQINDYFNLK